MSVKCLVQEHNTMSPARARTQTARSGVEPTNHEATTPPWPRLEPKRLDLKSSVLTIRLPRLSWNIYYYYYYYYYYYNICFLWYPAISSKMVYCLIPERISVHHMPSYAQHFIRFPKHYLPLTYWYHFIFFYQRGAVLAWSHGPKP